MGSVAVVILLPDGDLCAGFGQGRKKHVVQERVAEPAVEALDVGVANAIGPKEWPRVLRGFAGRDLVPVDGGAPTPGQDRRRSEPSAIIADNGGRWPASDDDPNPVHVQNSRLIVTCSRSGSGIPA